MNYIKTRFLLGKAKKESNNFRDQRVGAGGRLLGKMPAEGLILPRTRSSSASWALTTLLKGRQVEGAYAFFPAKWRQTILWRKQPWRQLGKFGYHGSLFHDVSRIPGYQKGRRLRIPALGVVGCIILRFRQGRVSFISFSLTQENGFSRIRNIFGIIHENFQGRREKKPFPRQVVRPPVDIPPDSHITSSLISLTRAGMNLTFLSVRGRNSFTQQRKSATARTMKKKKRRRKAKDRVRLSDYGSEGDELEIQQKEAYLNSRSDSPTQCGIFQQ